LTIIWRVYPIQQTGYYTTFFWGNEGSFEGTKAYFGCHPYPQGGSSGTDHNWEVSIETGDDITDENANDTTVTKGQWYSQAATCADVGGNDITVNFYWNLTVNTNRLIAHTTNSDVLLNLPTNPGLFFGDAPWSPGNELLSGRLRGVQVYESVLTLTQIEALAAMEYDADVLSYCTAQSITSLWYLNMNPTPSDVTDKSGNGNDPTWTNANRPTLWEE
jgi:hypothetical protein